MVVCVALAGCAGGTPAMSSEGWHRLEATREAVPLPDGYAAVPGSAYRQGGEGCSWGPSCEPTARVIGRFRSVGGYGGCTEYAAQLHRWNDDLEERATPSGCVFEGRVGPDHVRVNLRLSGTDAHTLSVVVQEAEGR